MKWLQACMEKIAGVFADKKDKTQKELEFPNFEGVDDLCLGDYPVDEEQKKVKKTKKKKPTKKKVTKKSQGDE
jgi:hypothetical protein